MFNNSEPLSVCNVIGGLSRSNCVKAATNDAADLFFQRNAPGPFRKYIDHRQEERSSIVGLLQPRHVDYVGLPLLVRTTHYDATAFEVTSHRFVKRIRILFRQPLFDVLFWDDLSQCGNTTVTSDTFRVIVYLL